MFNHKLDLIKQITHNIHSINKVVTNGLLFVNIHYKKNTGTKYATPYIVFTAHQKIIIKNNMKTMMTISY